MSERNNRKSREGIVVGNKMDKTVIVSIDTFIQHPLYKKRVKRSKRLKVHDERNECRAGDKVEIMETRPLSKHKNWRVSNIIEKAK